MLDLIEHLQSGADYSEAPASKATRVERERRKVERAERKAIEFELREAVRVARPEPTPWAAGAGQQTLSEATKARIRELAEAGLTRTQIADEAQVSRRAVTRVLGPLWRWAGNEDGPAT
jgi:hypothetical protein